MLLPLEIITESASTVTFPGVPVSNGVPAEIMAPFIRLNVLACTAMSPERAEPKVEFIMPLLGSERVIESALLTGPSRLTGPSSPCTVTVPLAPASVPPPTVSISMLAPPEMLRL